MIKKNRLTIEEPEAQAIRINSENLYEILEKDFIQTITGKQYDLILRNLAYAYDLGFNDGHSVGIKTMQNQNQNIKTKKRKSTAKKKSSRQ